jgi:hypothetical protein
VIEIELQPFDISKKGGFSLNSLPITPWRKKRKLCLRTCLNFAYLCPWSLKRHHLIFLFSASYPCITVPSSPLVITLLRACSSHWLTQGPSSTFSVSSKADFYFEDRRSRLIQNTVIIHQTAIGITHDRSLMCFSQ